MTRRHARLLTLYGGLTLTVLVTPFAFAQREGTLRIYVARHGQTDWNLEGRLQGWTDTPLNATGRQQAAELARRLAGVRFETVYSSALRRSRETAEVARGGAPLTSLPGLNERRLGKFEGQRLSFSTTGGTAPTQAATTQDPLTLEYLRRTQDPDDSLEGGESLNQFYGRVNATAAELRGKHASGTILIVGHGVTNRMILRALLGLTADQANGIQQANDELYLIELDRSAAPRLWKLITEKTLNEL